MDELHEVHNGEATDAEWECGGYQFQRVAGYAASAARLPRLAGVRDGRSYLANAGEHVVTFRAQAINQEAERESRWLKGGTSLHDVLALWSFVGGLPVLVPPIKRAPTADERGYALADESEVVSAVRDAYRACRLRPVKRRVWSALLTYLEIAHVRPMQLKAVLVTSVLECLAPISMAIGSESEDRSRYRPIVDYLGSLRSVAGVRIPQPSIESLVVELFRIRNGFLHGGVHPYRDDIELGSVKTTTGRIVSGSRRLAKLGLAQALSVPSTWTSDMVARQVLTLLTDGSFVPKDVEELMRRAADREAEAENETLLAD